MATRSVPQPPFTSELLADLHAGNVSPAQREQLWPMVSRDPEAMRYLRSLDNVSAELRALGRDERVIHRMPEDVAARLALFADELEPPEDAPARAATVHELPRPSADEIPDSSRASDSAPVALDDRRRSRLRWFAAAAAAIVTVACASVFVTTMRDGDAPAPTAQPTTGNEDVGDDLTATVALSALGRNNVTGSLARPGALERCIQANGLDRTVLGSTDIRFRGGNAVLILLNGPHPPKITALVVGTGCATGDPQRRALQDIG
ncbi:hypothetical protein IU486_07015 [Streptomyces gardneri]|uniref:hypothetical protein n=1 Tax=Nocardia TaxID=1817 RepID=UPI00135C2C73|nr:MULTISPECIES: hypothetical protein [Nocardia]MBF6164522.1 hypothetical protein [Streptomyces gardneri]MBF6203953.1 hypothetical protein [Streptomyces gardneri]UAK33957.1 hypothetical protein K8O92_08665 [Nocardia asteroides]